MKPKCPHCHKVIKTVEETFLSPFCATNYIGEDGKFDNSKYEEYEEDGDRDNYEFQCGECGETLDEDFVGTVM